MTMWHLLTDAERDTLVERAIAGVAECHVPMHLRDGLVRYFSDGILPGSFLQAVLCNDLAQAILRAAPNGLSALPPLILFLQHYAPASAWGSRDLVLAWTTTPDRLEIP
jgi:hypothetical protein